MEDQAAAVGEVGSVAVAVLLVGSVGVLDGGASLGAVLTKEGQVVGLVDLNTGDLIETSTAIQITLSISNLAIENIRVHRGNKTVILPGAKYTDSPITRSRAFI